MVCAAIMASPQHQCLGCTSVQVLCTRQQRASQGCAVALTEAGIGSQLWQLVPGLVAAQPPADAEEHGRVRTHGQQRQHFGAAAPVVLRVPDQRE